MRRRLAFMLLALASVPASAASFDCNKAATPIEKAICADPELSQADEDMALAFSAARKALSPEASAVVLDNQRAWIDFAARACTDDARPKTSGRYDADGIACLGNLFRQRAASLRDIGPMGGSAVFAAESFDVTRDPDPESWSKVALTEVSIAQLDASGPEAEAINAYARSLATSSGVPADFGDGKGTVDYSQKVALQVLTPQRAGFAINEDLYAHGAAHGMYVITFANWLRGPARPLVAEDVFVGRDWAVELKPLIIARLKQMAASEFDDAEAIWPDLEGLEEQIASPERWDIGEDGIGFQFQPYEVTAYAYGAPQAEMSWDELAPWLQRSAQTLLLGE